MGADNFTVLICDDSILARKQLSDAIKECSDSISFLESSNGQECVDMYNEHHPDLVFIDIVMPVLDGVGAVRSIISQHPEANIVIVSSIGTRSELKNAIEAGARDFIQKPISTDQIKEVIKLYLNE